MPRKVLGLFLELTTQSDDGVLSVVMENEREGDCLLQRGSSVELTRVSPDGQGTVTPPQSGRTLEASG